MTISLRGIKARPHDLDAMLAHRPSLVELHCSVADLDWMPTKHYDVPLAIHVPEFDQGELLDPASTDEATRLRAQEIYVRAGGRALALAPFFRGRPKVVFHPGGFTSDERASADPEPLLRALDKTTQAMLEAVGEKADVLIENLPSQCWFFGGEWKARIMTTGQELADFCFRNRMGCTLDLCHLHLAQPDRFEDAIAEITAALPYVRHLHYSDAQNYDAAGGRVNKEGLQIGEGDMPLVDYFAALNILHGLTKHEIHAVPEIWFGHEHGGAAFVEAWCRIRQVLRESEGREAALRR